MDRFLSLLLEVYDNEPGEVTNEELGLVTALLAANKSGGDVTLQNLRKRRTIGSRAFEFLVASATPSGTTRSDMQNAVMGDCTHLLLPSQIQMTQPPSAASFPNHRPVATPFTPTPAGNSSLITSVLGKRGRLSDANAETVKL